MQSTFLVSNTAIELEGEGGRKSARGLAPTGVNPRTSMTLISSHVSPALPPKMIASNGSSRLLAAKSEVSVYVSKLARLLIPPFSEKYVASVPDHRNVL